MLTPQKLLLAATVAVISFGVSLAVMNYFWPLCPAVADAISLQGPFKRFSESGLAYVASLSAAWQSFADYSDDSSKSDALVCENNLLIGPGHSIHQDIATKGRGASLIGKASA